ncbi:amidohydrolase family protein [Flexithrix dorotheae]|uniref:amidohydrolase family protein n=1 Tax=Flexithrix dorotheae TaxID=70993 RepID=UPI00035F9D3D|nr:amidohydrolase family protein [Flexithrix dorotheae]
MKRIYTICVLVLLHCSGLWAQEDIYPVNNVRDNRPEIYFLKNATIFKDYQTKLENASLLIEDGVVKAIGTNLSVPKGAREIDLNGKFIYPAFIDLHSDYGLSEVPKGKPFSFGSPEVVSPQTKGAFNVNDAIKSSYNAAEDFNIAGKEAGDLRKAGFGTVLASKRDGLARGTSALINLLDELENEALLQSNVAAHYSFKKGSSPQSYPISLMGCVAVLRQTYLDAKWYSSNKNQSFFDNSLEAWNASQKLPQIFDAKDWQSVLLADKIGDEFGVQYIIIGGGEEYKRIAEIKATNARLIVPLNFPDAYEVEDPFETQNIKLADMMHWELAPGNLAALEKAGIDFSLTADGLSNKSDFLANLRKAVKNGLSKTTALKAVSFNPAQFIEAGSSLGSLENGKMANFLIFSDDLFEEESELMENWVNGKQFIIKKKNEIDLSGKYSLEAGDSTFNLEISGKPDKHTFKIVINDSTKIDATAEFEETLLTLSFTPNKEEKAYIRLSGWRDGKNFKGKGQLPDGAWVEWTAEYKEELEKEEEEKKEEEKEADEVAKVLFPFLPYGNEEKPTAKNYLIKNATVWTNETDGILEGTDVYVEDGKIKKIGKNLSIKNAVEIDGTGKHLTPGIIDEHTHIALNNVNDVATNSGMVRMEDVIDSDDINIYRQLAGGVTAAQLLHGSANPVGGQSALVKFRWGAAPNDMLIKDADKYIKFALGENVKRSSNSNSVRYPQTRMGVEQVFMDGFTRAKTYDAEWAAYNSLSSSAKANATPPRRDLMLETMAEIINKDRFITCHSYVQSEINMLMKVAEKFDFNVNTFTHILEGYKVADKMAEHGAGGSTFADWWAYKFEVRYAIPYNPMLMAMAGVTVAINSDDAEMARRLNQEAAKSVKYGGMSEEDALKMVTLNPAKLLHLDDRMGSVNVGKDADLVLWNDHPLSIYAKPEKTMVDGIIYYDIEEDEKKREEIAMERARLIQKMQEAKKNGAKTQSVEPTVHQFWHCDDLHFGQIH